MTQINIRVDDDVKSLAEEVCAELGLSLSTAINIYLKKLGRERRIPFEVSAPVRDTNDVYTRTVKENNKTDKAAEEEEYDQKPVGV